ncbi:hypothetical protein [Polaromonas sp. AET17H-212]|uniref:hypothetical protein n=1 Tax=Polaromonas sp. AET17H-212 TaxID=1977061 RepID=UPI000BBCBACB|nr:hypothetical protein [Polaromonas sp. AET17H-212]
MIRTSNPTVYLDLPPGAGHSALRTALMAMRVVPLAFPKGKDEYVAALHSLADLPAMVAFVDISHTDESQSHTLPQLEALLPATLARQQIFLTRLAGGHVSEGDVRWAKALGFADLLCDLEVQNGKGSLRKAVDAVANVFSLPRISSGELVIYARPMIEVTSVPTPRAVIRSLTGLGAEHVATLLGESLNIVDRTYHLKTYSHCFVGSDAVIWLGEKFKRSRKEALAIGQALLALGLIAHVTGDHPFLDDRLFYHLAVSELADQLHLGLIFDGLRGPRGVPVADRSYLGKTYHRCWIGAEAADLLVKQHGVTRHDAWILLHRLMQFGLIEHVTRSRPLIDGAFFYRFIGFPIKREQS